MRLRIASRAARYVVGGVALLVAAQLAATAAPAYASGPTLTCSVHTLHVRLADPGPATQTMWGQLCYRGVREPSTVQLLVHGATYTHTYWDFPVGGGYFSYVEAATAAGYATFNVDRIGAGASSHPDSAGLNIAAGAVALHDAVTALRSGAVGGHAFARVIYVGHSLGSMHGWIEAGTYHDVDGVILTGELHAVSQSALAGLPGDFYPAVADPRFAGSGLDQGYLTTVPGVRRTLFYSPPTTDPAVLAADEATKDTITAAQIADLGPLLAPPPAQALTQRITVPVLLVTGQDDAIFCGPGGDDCAHPGAVSRFEEQYYSPRAQLLSVIIPATGHDLALSTTAPLTDAVMLAWSRWVVAP